MYNIPEVDYDYISQILNLVIFFMGLFLFGFLLLRSQNENKKEYNKHRTKVIDSLLIRDQKENKEFFYQNVKE